MWFIVFSLSFYLRTRWAKNAIVLNDGNLAKVSGKKTCCASEVLEFCLEKVLNF